MNQVIDQDAGGRLEQVKQSMGCGYVLHPNYKPTPRHSNDPAIYGPARAGFIAGIKRAAAADRARNPEYRRVQALARFRNQQAGA